MNKEFVNDCESSVAVSFSGISKLVIKRLLLLTVGGLVLWSVGTYPEVHGCTSWMVFSDLTKNNTNILHKLYYHKQYKLKVPYHKLQNINTHQSLCFGCKCFLLA